MTNLTDTPVVTTECCAGMTSTMHKARAALEDARERIINAAPIATARARARAVDEYAHRSPWTVIGGAALLALAVGFLVRRR